MKHVNICVLLLISLASFGQNSDTCRVKLNKRPDGVTVKYLNPKPIGQNNFCQIGVSLSSNGLEYFLNTTVRFAQNAQKSSGNLLVQLSIDNSLDLPLYKSELAVLGGETVSLNVYELSSEDISYIKEGLIKTVSFRQQDGIFQVIQVSMNQDILKQQLACLESTSFDKSLDSESDTEDHSIQLSSDQTVKTSPDVQSLPISAGPILSAPLVSQQSSVTLQDVAIPHVESGVSFVNSGANGSTALTAAEIRDALLGNGGTIDYFNKGKAPVYGISVPYSEAARYNDPKLGYSPYRDNEAIYREHRNNEISKNIITALKIIGIIFVIVVALFGRQR